MGFSGALLRADTQPAACASRAGKNCLKDAGPCLSLVFTGTFGRQRLCPMLIHGYFHGTPRLCPPAALISSLTSLQMAPSTGELAGGCGGAGPSPGRTPTPALHRPHPAGPQAAERFLLAARCLQLFGTGHLQLLQNGLRLLITSQVISR